MQIAKFAEAWVITRANNRDMIEEELSKNPVRNLHFVYVDLPKYLRFWKKRQRGVHLYYCLWQFAAYLKTLSLVRKIGFDFAHHITFVNDWMPSFLAFLPLPFLWGPVGSNRPIPGRFTREFSHYTADRFKNLAIKMNRFLNVLYIFTFLRSAKTILISKNQLHFFPFSVLPKSRITIQQANAVDVAQMIRRPQKKNTIVYTVGSLVPIKGYDLALGSFVKIIDSNNSIRYIITGDGWKRQMLKEFTHKHGLGENVSFTGELSRSEVLNKMKESDIFLFPSFEGGGMVVLEAMAAGLPIVCLDYGGPGEMVTDECGIKVRPTTYDETVQNLADAIMKLSRDPALRRRMGKAGIRRVRDYYTWEKKGEFIKQLYASVLTR